MMSEQEGPTVAYEIIKHLTGEWNRQTTYLKKVNASELRMTDNWDYGRRIAQTDMSLVRKQNASLENKASIGF